MARISIVSSCLKECSHRESASTALQIFSDFRIVYLVSRYPRKGGDLLDMDGLSRRKQLGVEIFQRLRMNAPQAREHCCNFFSPNMSIICFENADRVKTCSTTGPVARRRRHITRELDFAHRQVPFFDFFFSAWFSIFFRMICW